MENLENYYGRQFLSWQLSPALKAHAQTVPATFKKSGKIYCSRCNSYLLPDWVLPDGSYYCRNCIAFGRVTSTDQLCYFKQKAFSFASHLSWQGQLTSYQQEISDKLVSAVEKREDILVHAVTGSGKTEMTYQAVASVLQKGEAVALVSPRIDVCRELYQRFRRDFTCPISLLHSGSENYHRSPLLISTVHQLFKFRQAFELIIIDEVDAFPYVDDQGLYQAVANALKPQGSKIFLTATSTDNLDKAVKKRQIKEVHLARRFHAHPLVLPKLIWLANLDMKIKRGQLPAKLLSDIKRQRKTKYPLLLFYPTIAEGQQLAQLLQNYLPEEKVSFISSRADQRLDLVQDFRDGKIDLLVSSTILERGVTFPKIDLFVLDAHHKLYTKSSLIQIAGRVGRSSERPTGSLRFYHGGVTKAMRLAISDIKTMNKRGGF
ncbi:DEAD/DEAH box helicase [Streptococcus tangpeifui]|uniref:DEAD/DEAH box helicase n=1 Tax=Streptococcus tangpeifui TaxID=2709400 RepID=UPI0013ED7C29|nr:DEAD/DEAH box helicase [Streptococcus sp. ZJ373]